MSSSGKHPLRDVYADLVQRELDLEQGFPGEFRVDLKRLDDATSLLIDLMSQVEPHAGPLMPGEIGVPRGGDVQRYKLFALIIIGARAVRVIRATRALLTLGYEIEALTYDRILSELMIHRRAVITDETGDEARKWLEAPQGRGMGKRIAAVASGDLYRVHSQSAHGDGRILSALLDHNRGVLRLVPSRTGWTRWTLMFGASFLVDHAEMIAYLANIEAPTELATLTSDVKTAWAELRRNEREA